MSASIRTVISTWRKSCGLPAEAADWSLPIATRSRNSSCESPEGIVMKAWRFYAFGDMRLDDIPVPEIPPGHVLVAPLCVQPSVTEAQLAFGIPTLAYD